MLPEGLTPRLVKLLPPTRLTKAARSVTRLKSPAIAGEARKAKRRTDMKCLTLRGKAPPRSVYVMTRPLKQGSAALVNVGKSVDHIGALGAVIGWGAGEDFLGCVHDQFDGFAVALHVDAAHGNQYVLLTDTQEAADAEDHG
jgi:hypothetical protein